MTNRISLLFIGGIYTKEMEDIIFPYSKGVKQDAANQMQLKFIKGFDNLNTDLTIINAPFLQRYPYGYSKHIKTPFFYFSHNQKQQREDVNIGYLNIPLFRNQSKYRNAKKHIKKWLNSETGERIVVLYSLNSFTSECAKFIKKNDSKVRVCMIVPDLPEYAYRKKGLVNDFFIKREIKRSYRFLNFCDCFVGLTNEMRNKLVPNKDFILIDCIIDSDSVGVSCNDYLENANWITYTGTLSEKYGIVSLLECFDNLKDEDVELHICGYGNKKIEDFIKIASERNKKIVFHGLLSHYEAELLQKKSLLLINPRTNEGEYTKYSFPSKNAEYMLSGIPCAFYKLDGIEDDYFKFAFRINDYDSMDLLIKKVLGMEKKKLWSIGDAGREFMLSNKNCIKQCSKILNWAKGGK